MQRAIPIWCYPIGVLVLAVPIGLRALTWRSVAPLNPEPDAVAAGAMLFHHEWTPNDPLANGGDGLGPVFNARSCVACHHQGGAGGGGDLAFNVTTFTVRPTRPGEQPREGVIHSQALGQPETLSLVNPDLPPITKPSLNQLVGLNGRRDHCISVPTGVHLSQRNTPALFGASAIDALPDRVILAQERAQRLAWGMAGADQDKIPVGRALRLANGRVGKFGWKAQSASLADFVQAACANELGLGNPGQKQPTPLNNPGYVPPALDLTAEQCDQITAFVAALPRPAEKPPVTLAEREQAGRGKQLFKSVGCAACHTPDLGGVEGLYSDLLLHKMGEELQGGGSYNDPPIPVPDVEPGQGPQPGEWRTPPLWGVADSAPYLHDGRAPTLEEAIRLHGGQGARAARHFARLQGAEKTELIAFLKTLRAP